MARKRGNKKAGKQARNKQAARPRGRKTYMALSGHGTGTVPHAICAISDPFCPGAHGAKWPDNSHTKSLTWSLVGQNYIMGSNASGTSSVLYVPGVSPARADASAIAGTTVTYFDALNQPSAPPSTAARWRITSWGFRLSSPLSKMTATGTVHIRLFSPDFYASLGTLDFTTIQADNMMDVPLSKLIDQDVCIVPMPLGTDARLFNPSSAIPTLLSTGMNPGWQCVNIAVSGAPNTNSNVLNIYAYFNLEYVPTDGDTTYAFATAPPRSSPYLQQGNATVLEKVGNFVSGGLSKVEALFRNKAAQYAMSGLAGYLTAGPAGAASALMLTNRAAIDVD